MDRRNSMADSNKLKETLLKTVSGLKENPSKAKVVFNADTELVDGFITKSQVRQFHFTVDEPKQLGGTDTAPNPVEYVLAALGTCQEIVYKAYATVLDIPLDAVKVNVRGSLDLRGLFGIDDKVNSGFEEITYETELISSAEQNKLQELISIVESKCPVLDTLTRSIKVSGNVKINKVTAAA